MPLRAPAPEAGVSANFTIRAKRIFIIYTIGAGLSIIDFPCVKKYIMFMKRQTTILFLEDERELLSTISNLLRENGYAVIESTSAEDAQVKIQENIPDLIIADIKLPGEDGLEFFQQLRTQEQFKKIPFVFLTAFNNLKAAMNAKKQGAAEYITKPFDFEYLVTRVRELLPP
jgi:CheY-like chemotaxis protein